MKRTRGSLLVFAMLYVGLISSGCGKGQGQTLVTGVQVNAHTDNGATYVGVKATLNTGAAQFASLSYSVADPNNPGEIYGTIAINQGFNGLADLILELNVTKMAHLQNSDGNVLPNGTGVPVGGLNNTPIIGIPISKNGSRVYVALGNGIAMVGVAVVIKEFNGLGGYVGTANLFPMFDFGKGVRGVAGIFSSQQQGQSGIALFVDAKTALAGQLPELASNSKTAGFGKSMLIESAQSAPDVLTFTSPKATTSTKNRVNAALYELHRKRARLHAH